MAIESISGAKRYRVNPKNPFVVQVQEKHRGRWELFKPCNSAAEATSLVLYLAHNVRDGLRPASEEQEG